MYHILTTKIENDQEDAILGGDSPYLRRIDCSFKKGTSLAFEDIDTPISFKIYEHSLRGSMTDHLNLNDISGPILSLNTKTLLEIKGIKNVQFFQLKLIDEFPEGEKPSSNPNDKPKPIEYTHYYIANVVGLVDCVNHEKSRLEYFYPPELRNQPEETEEEKKNNPFADENPNDIDFITKLVLDENKIDPSLKVFRLKDKPDLLIFHESIVKEIRKEKLSGFVFVPVEEYTDVIPDDDAKTEDNEEPASAKVINEPKHLPAQTQQPEEQKEKKKSRFNFFSE